MRVTASASILAAAVVAILLGPSLVLAAPPSSVRYELYLDCPQSLRLQPGTMGRPNSIGVVCPIKALDEDDIMGSPSLAVDADNPNNLIIASLHGVDGNGPTERSRGRQPFTTFLSDSHGEQWFDRPYYPPQRVRNSLGEHAQVFIDPLGHVFVGSLYSQRAENSASGWNYTLVPQKFVDFPEAIASQGRNGEFNARYVSTYFPDQMVDQFWFVQDPKTMLMTLVWNERKVVDEELASLLPTQAKDDSRSVLGMAWSTPKPTDGWHRLNRSRLVGPCLTTTNPVLSQGQLYIGCMVNTNETKDEPYKWTADPKVGQIDMFRFNVTDDRPQFLGTAPIRGGQPMLGVRQDGRVVLLSAYIGQEGAFKLAAAYGTADPDNPRMMWTTTKAYGDDILRPTVGRRILSTTMQDVMYREGSGVVHIIIKQQFEPLGINVDSPTDLLKSQYNKIVVAVHEEYGVLAKINLDVGNIANRTIFSGVAPPSITNPNPEGIYNDLTDDIIELPPADFEYKGEKLSNYQREFFAVGDYGTVIFGELIEITNLRAPGSPPPEPPPPAQAASTTAVSAQVVITGTVATALVGLLALKLALARRSDPATAITKAGK